MPLIARGAEAESILTLSIILLYLF